MKRNKKLLILLAAFVVILVATLILSGVEDKKEDIKTNGESIISIDTSKVTTLYWKYDNSQFSFHKDGDTWIYDADEAFPVAEEAIENLLDTFKEFKASFTIENADKKQYGLAFPSLTIKFTADGNDYEIGLGNMSSMDSQRYASIGDGNVYLLPTDPCEVFEIGIEELIENDTIPSFKNIEMIKFTGTDGYTIEADDSALSYCEDDKYFTKVNGKALALETENVEDYCGTLSMLNPKTYVTYNATKEELSSYGFDNPSLKIDITDENGSYTYYLAQNPDDLEKKKAAEDKGEEYDGTVTSYLRVGDSNIIYQITEDKFESLMAYTISDLRHGFLFTADFDDVTGMDITIDGTTYKISSKNNTDSRTYLCNDEEIDISNIKTKLTAIYLNEFTKENTKKKQEISMTIYLDNEDFPSISIKLYRFRGSNCIAELDGETLGTVTRSYVVNLVEAIYAKVLG